MIAFALSMMFPMRFMVGTNGSETTYAKRFPGNIN